MSIDNILRTMNEYISDIFNMYGGQSQEYTTALRQVRENLSDEVLSQVSKQGLDYTGDTPDKAFQFSRGKQAQQILQDFQGDLQQLRKEQREAGTAKVQAQKYYKQQKIDAPDAPVSTSQLKAQAADRYDWNNNVNDWYKQIDESEEVSAAEKEQIKEEYRKIQLEYEDMHFRDNLQKKAKKILDKADKTKKDKQAIEAAEKEAAEHTLGVGMDLGDII